MGNTMKSTNLEFTSDKTNKETIFRKHLIFNFLAGRKSLSIDVAIQI